MTIPRLTTCLSPPTRGMTLQSLRMAVLITVRLLPPVTFARMTLSESAFRIAGMESMKVSSTKSGERTTSQLKPVTMAITSMAMAARGCVLSKTGCSVGQIGIASMCSRTCYTNCLDSTLHAPQPPPPVDSKR